MPARPRGLEIPDPASRKTPFAAKSSTTVRWRLEEKSAVDRWGSAYEVSPVGKPSPLANRRLLDTSARLVAPGRTSCSPFLDCSSRPRNHLADFHSTHAIPPCSPYSRSVALLLPFHQGRGK